MHTGLLVSGGARAFYDEALSIPFVEDSLGEVNEYHTETGAHSSRTALVGAEAMLVKGMPQHGLAMAIGGVLHDFGKITVPLDILDATTPLSEAQWEVLRKHTEHSYAHALQLGDPIVLAICQNHHDWITNPYNTRNTERRTHAAAVSLERRIGERRSGGNLLSDLARIFSAGDCADAAAVPRAYNRALSFHERFFDVRTHGYRGDPRDFDRAMQCYRPLVGDFGFIEHILEKAA